MVLERVRCSYQSAIHIQVDSYVNYGLLGTEMETLLVPSLVHLWVTEAGDLSERFLLQGCGIGGSNGTATNK